MCALMHEFALLRFWILVRTLTALTNAINSFLRLTTCIVRFRIIMSNIQQIVAASTFCIFSDRYIYLIQIPS